MPGHLMGILLRMSMLNSMPPLTATTFLLLWASIIALWFGRRAWVAVLAIAAVAGYASHVLYGLGGLWVALFAGFCVAYERATLLPRAGTKPGVRPLAIGLSAAGLLIVALLLGLHALPGFNNFLTLDHVVLSPGAEPYTLYLNFDKTIVGICILGICSGPLLKSGADWGRALRHAVPLIVISTALVAGLALAVGYLTWQPKWTSLFWIWALSNLFFTCLSEEALFRGFIQRQLSLALAGKSFGPWVAIGVSASLFGIAHFGGGLSYVALATAAGVGYGIVYHRTKSIEMSMLAHFALNATHFLLFTYPRTA